MLKKIKIADWMLGHKYGAGLTKLEPLQRLMMCKRCHTFYYKNSWHFETPTYLSENQEEEIPVLFTQCLACLQEEEAVYENEKESDLNWGGMAGTQSFA